MTARPKNTGGYIYVVTHAMTPSQMMPRCKLGFTSFRIDDPKGRVKIMKHWLEVFGLGGPTFEWCSLYHAQAWDVEQRAKNSFDRSDIAPGCGKSKETFAVEPSEVIERIYRAFSDLGL